MKRNNILIDALKIRKEEIMGYQINIDNYTRAIEKINSLPESEQQELNEFKEKLETLLTSEKLEQKKAKIIERVINDQVNEMPISFKKIILKMFN